MRTSRPCHVTRQYPGAAQGTKRIFKLVSHDFILLNPPAASFKAIGSIRGETFIIPRQQCNCTI